MGLTPNFAKSQIINELCFNDLVGDFLAKDDRKFSDISGFTTSDLRSKIQPTENATFKLMIENPDVNFQNLEGPYFERSISVNLIFQDSTEHPSTVTWTDTIHRSQLKQVRKTAYRELRGTDPRWTAKYLMPALLVGAGISGIISLFYIRSS